MKPRKVMNSRFLALSFAAVLLLGCSSAKNLLDFGDKDTVLPGQRESVLENSSAVTDSAISSDPIVIPAAQTNPGWMQPGGSTSNALHNLTLGPQPVRAFAIHAGKGSSRNGRLTASPIVAGGRVFVLDTEATVRAFSAQSGGAAWTRSLVPDGKDGKGAFGGGLASDGQRLYATTAFGEALALDLATGSVLWRKQIGSPIRAAPNVADGRIVFVSVANQVYCLSTADGTELWASQGVGESAAVMTSTSAAIDGDIVVVPQTSGDVTAFRLADGTPLWTDTLASTDTTSSLANLNDIAARPVIDGGQVFAISHSGSFAAFEAKSGARSWQRDLAGTQTPWVSGDYLFVVTHRNQVAAISRKSGGVRWIKDLQAGVWSGPVMGGGKLIVASSEGKLVMLSAQTGEILHSIDLKSKIFVPPIIASGTIYLLADDGDLIAMR
jgi:outer membrane protein assembly factor BamB